MSWLVFAIAAPALYGVSNFLDKFLIEKRIKDPILLTIFGGIIVFFAGVLIFVIRGFPIFSLWQIFILILGGAMTEIALVPYYKALSLDEASRIISLFQIIPVIVLVLSYIFIGETLLGGQIWGFLFILTGAFLLSIKKLGFRIFELRKSFWYIMLADLLFATPFVIFKFVVIRQGFWDTLTYEFFGVALGAFLLFLFYRRRFLSEFKSIRIKTWGVININEGVYFAARLCGFYAATLGPISLVSVVGGIQPFFALIYGLVLSIWFPHIVKEDIAKSTLGLKIIAIILVFVGIWLINL